MIANKYLFILLFCLPVLGNAQVISEDFDHNSQATSEGNCWEYDNVSLISPLVGQGINTGGQIPLAEANITSNGGITANLYSPFMQFDGTGSFDFEHRVDSDDWYYASSYIQVYLEDPAGVVYGPYFTHIYRQLSWWNPQPNGDPTITQTESVNITWSGYYRVRFYWSAWYNFSMGQIDAISINGVTAADYAEETNGYCPCIMNYTDTVCGLEQDDPRDARFNRAGRTYAWSWTGSSGGTLDLSISGDDSDIEVDWGSTSATYTLHSKESTSGGQPGNETNYEVFVRPLPTYSYTTDTVCPDEAPALTLTPAGPGPFTVTYDDGSGVQTVNVPGANAVVMLSVGAPNVNIISVIDGNGCTVDPATLGVMTIPYLPAVSTGSIYH